MTGRSFHKYVLAGVINFVKSNPGIIYFQYVQDYVAVHTDAVKNLLKGQGIEPVAWPPCSPDLNLVEFVWSTM